MRQLLHLESYWWIDTLSFALILVAGIVSVYILIQTENARERAEEKVITLERQTEALNPCRQPITDFSATVWIAVKSNGEWKANMHGVFAWFMQGEEKLIALSAITTMRQNLIEYVNFYAKTTDNLVSTLIGKPIAFLKNIEII